MSLKFPEVPEAATNHAEAIILPIDKELISIRCLSPKRLRFELEYALERGSTANSFLFQAGIDCKNNLQPAVLIHPPGEVFSEVFIPALAKALPDKTQKILVVVGHVNPNRVALLKKLADIYSEMELICSNPGFKLLQDLWNLQKPSKNKAHEHDDNSQSPIPPVKLIRKEENINLTNFYQLKLIPIPTARWPGGLIAFEDTSGLLLSDKFFAAHICTSQWAENTRSSTEEERRHYFDCLMAPMAAQVDSIVQKIEELDIRTIAPGHGPAIDGSWRSLLNDYRHWGEGQSRTNLKVTLLFASAYGNTAAIADALAQGINRTGVQVESINCEFASTKELLNGIKQADGYLIGSPTIGGHAPTPIVSALGTLISEGDRKKPIGIFGSYGWSGEALDILETKLNDSGFEFGFPPIKIKFSPNASMVKTLEETGTLFGRKLLNKERRKKRQASGGMSTSKSNPSIMALGRVIGSLCILTTKKETGNQVLSGAMVASWVSQASFTPPGISVAVAKDRAVETMLHCGDRFALNILAENQYLSLMKQFLQPFSPGANRFEGVTITDSPNKQPILPEALAWLEGIVQNRMECGDHWLIYGEIKHGKVLESEAVTAIHHRRTGANY